MPADQGGYVQPPIPPTQFEMAPPPPRSTSWAMIIGIIAVVFGGFALLGGLINTVSPLLMGAVEKIAPPQQRVTLEITRRWASWTIPLGLVMAALAALLLIAGIGLLQRRRWSRAPLLAWSPLKMVSVVVNTAVAWQIQQDTFQHLQQLQATSAALPANFTTMVSTVSTVFALIWGFALPVFVLIWFLRGSIKAQMAEWR